MTTYSISLDDVDLALLPLRTQSYNNFLKKEHFQFEIMREPTREPTNITYTCHICALEVPAAFAREHATSIKHRANARIASVAAERTRALITALPPPTCAQPTARFCANCATVVGDDHDRTKEHRVAAMHDNLLWELMKAYVGDDQSKDKNEDDNKIVNGVQDISQDVSKKDDTAFKYDNENNKRNGHAVAQAIDNNQPTNKTEDTTEDREAKTANSEINDKNKETLSKNALDKAGVCNNINKIDDNQLTNSVQPTTSAWVKLETKKVTENGTNQNEPIVTKVNSKGDKTKLNKEPYEKELRKFMEANNVFQIKEMYHRVQLHINEDTVNVYSDHFHGFHRMYNNSKVECIVCNKTFEQKDTEAHKYELNHMSAVAKIGDDGNYVRKISETHSHCIMCNQKINNINVAKHKLSQHHNLRKTNNVRTVKSNPDKTKENTTEKNNNEVTDEQTENTTVNKDDTVKESVEINKHPYKIDSGELRCVVCDCRVPRDLRNREDHLKGLRHINNLKTK